MIPMIRRNALTPMWTGATFALALALLVWQRTWGIVLLAAILGVVWVLVTLRSRGYISG